MVRCGSSDALVYDPVAESSSSTFPVNPNRNAPTLTRLVDGRVLLVGGSDGLDGDALDTAELFDPMDDSWRATSPMPMPRMKHAAVLLEDGRVLITGGSNGSDPFSELIYTSAEIFDPVAETWSEIASPSTPRTEHAAAVLSDGAVLVLGGRSAFNQWETATELYDPATNTWQYAPPLPASVVAPAPTTLLSNGSLLVLNWSSVMLTLDSTRSDWVTTALMEPAASGYSATELADGRVLIAGGDDLYTADPDNTGQIYDPATDAWSWTARPSGYHYNTPATRLLDGRVLAVGSPSELYTLTEPSR